MLENLYGIFPAVITPFTGDGAVDLAALKANIKRWNQYGLHGYTVIGSTGEAPFLSDDERQRIIETTRREMADGMTLLVGAGRESTAHTIQTCRAAADAGADAALVLTPCFYKPALTPAALERHYRAVADASPIPVLLYNMPAFTGISLTLETIVALAEHPNIVGLKDSSGNSQALSNIIRSVPADFTVFTGNAPSLAQALISGARGAILAVANVVPEICVALFRAAEAHNFSEVKRLQNLILSVSEVTGGSYGIGGLKYAMQLLGYQSGVPRLPLSPPTEAQRAKIAAALKSVGLHP